jgi:ribulose-5-phosphate 4-epimerase/fuculose-1-phosphate aldolase
MATATAADVALVTLDGDNLTPALRLHDETVMHLAVYRSRPDVCAIAHTHAVFAHVASLHGLPTGVYSQDQVPFAGSLAFFDNALLVNDDNIAAGFTTCLGTSRAALLRAHGLCTVGESVQEAVVLATLLERAMQILVTARRAGAGPEPMREDEVAALRTLFDHSHQTRVRDVWHAVTGQSGSSPSGR